MLYLVATPIGNLEDISYRQARILAEVDLIAAEDTRHTLKLLNHLNLHKPLVSYHEHNKALAGPKLIEALKNGQQIALVTDAGTPAISDPGEDLVRLCHEEGIPITSVPGPVALINALILSGFDTRRFTFEGFLPMQKKSRRERLEGLTFEERTMIFYEAPHKLKSTLKDFLQIFGGEREIALIREMTKRYEEIYRTTLGQAISHYDQNEPKGEFVLVLKGASEKQSSASANWMEALSLEDHYQHYIKEGMPKKEAIKQVAKDRSMPKREVYNHFIHEQDGD